MKFNFFNRINKNKENIKPLNKDQLKTFFNKNRTEGLNSSFEKFKNEILKEEQDKYNIENKYEDSSNFKSE